MPFFHVTGGGWAAPEYVEVDEWIEADSAEEALRIAIGDNSDIEEPDDENNKAQEVTKEEFEAA